MVDKYFGEKAYKRLEKLAGNQVKNQVEKREQAIATATEAAVHLNGFKHFAYKTEMLQDGYWSDTDEELDQKKDMPDDQTMNKELELSKEAIAKKEEIRLN
jgi:hypothetical protein